MLQRRIVTYFGQVQGVGFRYTACRVAAGFDVTGYVRNVPDGTVEIVAEGDRQEIDRFLEAIQRELGGYIRKTAEQSAAHQDQFHGFGVRY